MSQEIKGLRVSIEDTNVLVLSYVFPNEKIPVMEVGLRINDPEYVKILAVPEFIEYVKQLFMHQLSLMPLFLDVNSYAKQLNEVSDLTNFMVNKTGYLLQGIVEALEAGTHKKKLPTFFNNQKNII